VNWYVVISASVTKTFAETPVPAFQYKAYDVIAEFPVFAPESAVHLTVI